MVGGTRWLSANQVKTLVIYFRCYAPDNTIIRCRESEGPDNVKNRKQVQQKWKPLRAICNRAHSTTLNSEWYDLILFWSQAGIRPGELYALKWERVDFFNAKVMIRENRQYYGGDGPTKTAASNRDVDLRPGVVEALENVSRKEPD